MNLLEQYTEAREELFAYFGYVENHRVLPFDDSRGMYWRLEEEPDGRGDVQYAPSIEQLLNGKGDFYQNEIYTQRFLPKWVYRGEEYTMVVVDTHCDGNQFLQIFTNSLEVK